MWLFKFSNFTAPWSPRAYMPCFHLCKWLAIEWLQLQLPTSIYLGFLVWSYSSKTISIFGGLAESTYISRDNKNKPAHHPVCKYKRQAPTEATPILHPPSSWPPCRWSPSAWRCFRSFLQRWLSPCTYPWCVRFQPWKTGYITFGLRNPLWQGTTALTMPCVLEIHRVCRM